MKAKKYYVIIDTNQLGRYSSNNRLICKDLNFIAIQKDLFQSFVLFIKKNSLTKQVKIVIPKMVFEELKKQQVRYFNSCIQKMKNIAERLEAFNVKYDIPTIDYEKHLDIKISAFIGKYDIDVPDFPNNQVFPKLVNKVLNKEKPFYKKGGKDAGFKDAIIWESILEYAEHHKDGDYIFHTADKDFDCPELKSEFNDKTGRDINIISKLSEIKEYMDKVLQLKLGLDFIVSSFTETFQNNLYRLLIENFYQIVIDDEIYNIFDFGQGFKLLDISSLPNNMYEMLISFNVIHETPYTGYGVVDEIYTPYEANTQEGLLLLKVKRKADNRIILEGHKFIDIDLVGNSEIPKIILSKI